MGRYGKSVLLLKWLAVCLCMLLPVLGAGCAESQKKHPLQEDAAVTASITPEQMQQAQVSSTPVPTNPLEAFLADYEAGVAPYLALLEQNQGHSGDIYEQALLLKQLQIRLQRFFLALSRLEYAGEGGWEGRLTDLQPGQGNVWKTPDGYALRCLYDDGSVLNGTLCEETLLCLWEKDQEILGRGEVACQDGIWYVAVFLDGLGELMRADREQLIYASYVDSLIIEETAEEWNWKRLEPEEWAEYLFIVNSDGSLSTSSATEGENERE